MLIVVTSTVAQGVTVPRLPLYDGNFNSSSLISISHNNTTYKYPLQNFVLGTRTITINGNTQSLSNNPSWYIDAVPSGRTLTINGVSQNLSSNPTWSISATPLTRIITINGIAQDLSTNRTWTIDAVPTTRTLTINGVSQDLSSNKSWVLKERPYKVYTAILTQTGTNPPVATVLENTFNENFTFTYISTGYYRIESPNESFIFPKTTVISNLGFTAASYINSIQAYRNSSGLCSIFTATNGAAADGLLSNAYFEIRVYN